MWDMARKCCFAMCIQLHVYYLQATRGSKTMMTRSFVPCSVICNTSLTASNVTFISTYRPAHQPPYNATSCVCLHIYFTC